MAVTINQKNATNVPRRSAIFTFAAPENNVQSSHTLQKKSLIEALHRHNWQETGFFLESMEKGVNYPIVHFTDVSDTTSTSSFLNSSSNNFPPGIKVHRASYTEIKTFSPGIAPKPEIVDGRSHKAWIFMGFKTLDNTFNEVLEDNWKDWTGARLVYMNLSDEFGLSRLSFYRRNTPKDFDIFMYIMVVECESVSTVNRIKLLDFVQRLRVERMIGYLSVYKVLKKLPRYPNDLTPSETESNDSVETTI